MSTEPIHTGNGRAKRKPRSRITTRARGASAAAPAGAETPRGAAQQEARKTAPEAAHPEAPRALPTTAESPASTESEIVAGEALLAEGLSLEDAARRMGLSVLELARWSREDGGARLMQDIASLGRLCDARTRLLVGRARCEAAGALRRLALDVESKETARKACVDLLRLDEVGRAESARRGAPSEDGDEDATATGRATSDGPSGNDGARDTGHEEIRRLLEALGAREAQPGDAHRVESAMSDREEAGDAGALTDGRARGSGA